MNTKKINKILIANRGEIAVRIMRTLKRLHIESVAVFADNDANALHRRMADEAYPLGNGSLKDTYLNIQKIIDAALDSGADGIHPGFGFLSENPELVEACKQNNLIFIGPDADTMRLMGNKIAARQVAIENGIPVTLGLTGSLDDIIAQADTLPYPVLIKAAAGGGGKGMHIVRRKDDLKDELERASREAEKYFGDGTVFVEQYIENPRHIEVQILADHHGNVIHLGERECTIQRRYQKIIEESPSPTLTEEKRQQLLATAVKLCKGIGYKNAGTVEFIVDKNLNFYFLEVNTRIQVEHPVTEMRTGIDIVEEQIRIARDKEMGWNQEMIPFQGHAIELRIYAEDPENGFLPTPGKVTAYHEPQVRGARVDSSIDGPCTVSEAYDPMIAKLICHGKTRQAAIETAQHALKDFILQGLTTNKAYLWEVIKNPDFAENKVDTSFCATHQEALLKALNESRNNLNINDIAVSFLLYDFYKKRFEKLTENVWEEIGYWRFHSQFTVDVEGQKIPVRINNTSSRKIDGQIGDTSFTAEYIAHDGHQLKLMLNGRTEVIYCSVNDEQQTIVNFHGLNFRCHRLDQLNDTLDYSRKEQVNDKSLLVSPMPGKVVKINVKEGDEVAEGTVMIVVEAMKMENNIVATAKAKVKKILVTEGEMVDNKKQLVELEDRRQEKEDRSKK
ncbi:MAG: ATP-grasp domain-containing protein [Bacteroidales bacterium]|nr:ATP-grasp domain-containing protein [Bacteroidales bacterium]